LKSKTENLNYCKKQIFENQTPSNLIPNSGFKLFSDLKPLFSTVYFSTKNLIEISYATITYQPKFCVFLGKIWVNAQTVVMGNPKNEKLID